MQIALFDVNAGFLQWIGKADSHETAVLSHLADVGFNDDVSYSFRIVDVTDEQAAALSAWWGAGGSAPEYPDGLPAGTVISASEVVSIMDHVRSRRHTPG